MRTARSSTCSTVASARRRPDANVRGDQRLRIADDRVASAPELGAPSARAAARTHSRCSSGSDTAGVPVDGHPRQQRVRHQGGPLVGRHQQPDDGGDPAGQLGGVGTRSDGRWQAAYAEEVRAGSTRSSTTVTRACARAVPVGHGGQVDARRQVAALLPEPQPLQPAAGPALEAAAGPHVGQHLVERAADHQASRPPAAGRAAAAREVVAHVDGLERVAGQAVAAVPDAAAAGRSGVGTPSGDDVLGEHAGRDPDQLVGAAAVGRVDRPGPVRRRLHARPAARSGFPRPGAAAVRTRSARAPAAEARATALSRRSSSSCWAPGRTRADASASPVQSSHGVVPPSRRCATQPQARAVPSMVDRAGSALLAQPAGLRADASTPRLVGVGALGGLAGHHAERVEGGAELELGADPVGVAPRARRGRGGAGAGPRRRRRRRRRCALIQSIQRSASASA